MRKFKLRLKSSILRLFVVSLLLVAHYFAAAQTVLQRNDTIFVDNKAVFVIKTEKSYFSVLNLGMNKKCCLSAKIKNDTCNYTFYIKNEVINGQKNAVIASGIFLTNKTEIFIAALAREVHIDAEGNWNETEMSIFINKYTPLPASTNLKSNLKSASDAGRDKLNSIFGR